MSAAHTAEIRKLAHTLGVPVQRLDVLGAVPAADVRTLRTQIAQYLFEVDRQHFSKVAALSHAMPVAIAARLTEHAFPPLLAARTAELVDPRRAAELVARISDSYLADVSAAMDPARAPDVIAQIPAERIALVGRELARRGEWIVIGGFISHVTAEALAGTVQSFDGEQLLRIGFVLDDKDRLDDVAGLVSERQLDEMLRAAPEQALWIEWADLLDHLRPPRVQRLALRFAAAPEAIRSGFDAAVATGDLSKAHRRLLAKH